MSDDCSTDCKNLKTRFQFPLHRSNNSPWAFLLIQANIVFDTHSWNVAISTNDRNLWGYNPWLPPKVLEVNSKQARSTTPSRPEVKISKIKCDGKSSIETDLNRSPILLKRPLLWTPKLETQFPASFPQSLPLKVEFKQSKQLHRREISNFETKSKAIKAACKENIRGKKNIGNWVV